MTRYFNNAKCFLYKHAYSNDIQTIKDLYTKNNITNEEITNIMKLMKKHCRKSKIQEISCFILSDIAADREKAIFIGEKGILIIINIINNFISNKKICWYGTSALWNLALFTENRKDCKKMIKVILKILKKHEDENIVNTCIGSLSNISLENNSKKLIMKNIDIIIKITESHNNNEKVVASFSGLLANLAINDKYAQILSDKNMICKMLKILTLNYENVEIYRNTSSFMINILNTSNFLELFLMSEGIEKYTEYNVDNIYNMNLRNRIIHDITRINTSSYHMACCYGKLDVLKYLYTQNKNFSFDEIDEDNKTLLDYAIRNNHIDIIKFLYRCGANKTSEIMTQEVWEIKKEYQKVLENVKLTLENIFLDKTTMPKELCNLMISYQHNVDLLKSNDLF